VQQHQGGMACLALSALVEQFLLQQFCMQVVCWLMPHSGTRHYLAYGKSWLLRAGLY
jgi:hypothetical protein